MNESYVLRNNILYLYIFTVATATYTIENTKSNLHLCKLIWFLTLSIQTICTHLYVTTLTIDSNSYTFTKTCFQSTNIANILPYV